MSMDVSLRSRRSRSFGKPTAMLRGATLIELMVSLALLAVVLGVAVGLVVGAIQSGSRGRARGQFARQGSFINSLMSQELRMAGLGVPDATHIDDAYGGAGDTTGGNDVILATATAIGFIGDLPRPDAQYATFGTITNRPLGDGSHIFWHTENNGSCHPDTSAPSCETGDTSMFFPGEDGCANTAAVNDRTCPWGMKRVRAGERIQVVSGATRWTHAGVASPLAMSDIGAARPLSLNLSTTWNQTVWPNVANNDPPVAVSGQGFVTTVDRVFYFLQGTDLMRRQCFGDLDPDSASWPNNATNTLPANPESTPPGGVQNTCLAAEVIGKNVASLNFEYFDGTGAVTTTKNQIRRVDWTIKLRKTVNNRTVEQDVVGTVGLRN